MIRGEKLLHKSKNEERTFGYTLFGILKVPRKYVMVNVVLPRKVRKKSVKKRIVTALLVVTMAMGTLAGCGSKEADTISTPDVVENDENVIQESETIVDDTEETTEAEPLEAKEQEKFIVENEILPAYERWVNENMGDGSYGYNLIYIDEDNIPELLVVITRNRTSLFVLSYKEGSINETYLLNKSFFEYMPKGNRFICDSYDGTYAVGWVLHIEDADVVKEHEYFVQYKDDQYMMDDVKYSKEEYDALYNQYFSEKGMRKVVWTYNSIQDAYENVGKDTYTSTDYLITKFELVDNVLTIETEDCNNISYPVSDQCTWEMAGVTDNEPEFYGTTSYEEIKSSMDCARQNYVQYQEVESPSAIFVDIKDDVIVRVYTVSP